MRVHVRELRLDIRAAAVQARRSTLGERGRPTPLLSGLPVIYQTNRTCQNCGTTYACAPFALTTGTWCTVTTRHGTTGGVLDIYMYAYGVEPGFPGSTWTLLRCMTCPSDRGRDHQR